MGLARDLFSFQAGAALLSADEKDAPSAREPVTFATVRLLGPQMSFEEDQLEAASTGSSFSGNFFMQDAPSVFHLYFLQAGGSGRSLRTATDQDTHLIWSYRLGRQSAYVQHFSIFIHGDRLKNRLLVFPTFQPFAALLSQAE